MDSFPILAKMVKVGNNPPMKILFINQIDKAGGAAIAAWRISNSLEKNFETENSFIVASKHSDNENVFDCTPKNKMKRLIDEYILKITNTLGLQYISIPFHKQAILQKVKDIKPDIISLHNIHGGYFELGLLKKLSTYCIIVWTLHDMWSFTRNASYTFGKEAWQDLKTFPNEKTIYPQIGIDTGNYLIKKKKKIYQSSNLILVAPSKWLFDLAKQAPVFENKDIYLLPNAINLDHFNAVDKRMSKKEIGVGPNEKTIFFNSDWIKIEARKGGDKLLSILVDLNKNITNKVTLLLIGREVPNEIKSLSNLVINYQGKVYTENILVKLYNTSDVVIHPSIEDNLPNVLVEAAACGTPCIAFDVGGTSDIVINNYNGYLIKPFDINAFSSKIIELISDEEKLNRFSINARKHAEENFDSKIIARTYFSLFNKLLQ